MDHLKKIVLVNDTGAHLQLLTNLLTEFGCVVYPATDGDPALELIRSTRPDLILLDTGSAQADGYAVFGQLKANHITRSIPIILTIHLEDEAARAEGFRQGAVDYIAKPFQTEEVLAKVRLHLRLQELTGQMEEKIAERYKSLHAANAWLEHELDQRKQTEVTLRESNKRYQTLFEEAPVMYLTVRDKNGLPVISGCNAAFLSTLGYRRDEVLNRYLGDFYNTESREILETGTFQKALQGNMKAAVLRNLVTRDGRIVAALTRTAPDFGPSGKVIGTIVNYTDITDLKKAEMEIQENLFRQEALLYMYQRMDTEPVQNLISYVVDWCTNLTGSAIGLVGLVSDDVQYMEAHIWPEKRKDKSLPKQQIVFPISEAGQWAEPIRQRRLIIANDCREPNPFEDGHPGLSRFMGVPVVDKGRVVAVAGVANRSQDYSESDHYMVSLLLEGMWELIKRKRAEEMSKQAEVKLRKLNDELEQRIRQRTVELESANKELESFAYSVSHDLRAPLRHINGFVELLQKNAENTLDRKSRHFMEAISESTQKMGVLIDDLLSFSRMGRNAMSPQPVNPEKLVHSIIRELEPETADRNIQWCIGDLPMIQGDRAMLRIVLMNLIANALKFTRPCRQTRIEIGSRPDTNVETVFFVRDNGVGFDMAYGDKLFGVFQRLHRSEEFEGTGIGLANVQRIIARHGGRTWAEGDVGQGATFYFSLP
jgi:PAS domain S-box-containing protein